MIVLWGLPADSPLAAVQDALRESGCPVFFLDQRYILDMDVYFNIDSEIEGALSIKEHKISLEEITSAYIRPYDFRLLPVIVNFGINSPEWNHALYIEDSLNLWADIMPAYIINRPSSMATNNSKPYQSKLIKAIGFEVPTTLITTDPEEVLRFWKEYNEAIYKSISGIRSTVCRLSSRHLERIKDVSWCPTQFQQYIPGIDYRVHVVGTEVFACRIVSDADDYRYAGVKGNNVVIEAYNLPQEIAERCVKLSNSLDLNVAGIDLKHTNDNLWYCFEVNPSPGFMYFQNYTNQPIALSIAKLLAAAESR
jgi:RimK-like ATP-grasp domain